MKFTAVVPTFNRKNILTKCLKALFEQTYAKEDFEIVVIDDGSTDGTEAFVRGILKESPVALRYFKQPNKGPAAARNAGIKTANGEIILFIGDDIIATPTLIKEHASWHDKHPGDRVAVLGYVTWSPELIITPFMRWLEQSSLLFNFDKIADVIEINNPDYFFTCNVSVKRTFLIEENMLFDEEFPYAAHEDGELGHRLKQKGMVLLHNRSAMGYHHHFTSFTDACSRMIKVGESGRIYEEKKGLRSTPSPASVPSAVLAIFRSIYLYLAAKACYPVARYYETRRINARLYYFLLHYYHHVGAKRYHHKSVEKSE